MKNMIAAFGLLVSVMAFAISDSEKEALLNRNMGPVADRVQMGSLIMGGSGSVYVKKAGDTMTGTLRMQGGGSTITLVNNVANTNYELSSNAQASNVFSITPSTTPGGTTFSAPMFNVTTTGITSPGTIQAAGGTMSGNLELIGAGNTLNQKIYTTDNVLNATATITFGTKPGDRAKAQIGMVNTVTGNSSGAITFSTSDSSTLIERLRINEDGLITQPSGSSPWVRKSGDTMSGSLSLGSRAVAVALSGVSTFVSNSSVTSNVRVAVTGVGTSNVAPWLIGVSSGVGVSIGATGAGSAHLILLQGQ